MPELHPRIYTPAALLALRPAGPDAYAEAAKAHIRAACPAVLTSSRARKHAAFLAKQARRTSVSAPAESTPAPAPTYNASAIEVLAPTALPAQQRVTPRRTRPAGRGPERRRAALQLADNWRSMRTLAPPTPISTL